MPDAPDTAHHPDPRTLGARIVRQCVDGGFAAAGVATLEPSAWAGELDAWLDAGKHGSMDWLAKNREVRARPGELLEGARSAVMVADLYAVRAQNADEPLNPSEGRVARYARGGDYHEIIKRRLHDLCDALRAHHPGALFKSFVDTAPVLERELAARAGIGWTGKHTLTIHPRIGSYLVLGGFVTTLELSPPAGQERVSDHCGTCTRCIEACPTDAITPYSVDATRCISYLTIERRGAIDPGFFEGIGGWIFGCDVCQEVCPHNSRRERADLPVGGRDPGPAYASDRDRFDLLEVLGWTPEDRSRALSKSAMKRATLAMWKRNALIAAGNALRGHDLGALRARIESIAADEAEDAMVRDTARRVLAQRA